MLSNFDDFNLHIHMWLVAIILDSTALEPLLNVLLVFQQNSQLELTAVVVFMNGFG